VLRALVVLLLLANLAFYAWTQGWLDEVVGTRSIGDREPERLTRQVRPELVRILPPSAASAAAASVAAASAASTCLEAGPLDDAGLPAAQAAAQTSLPSGSWVMTKVEQPGSWMIYMGRFADREALDKKIDEIKRRKLPYEEIQGNPALAPGLSIGRFDSRAGADKALEQFAQQGVRTARVVELAPVTSRHWLRVEKADAALAARLSAMKVEAFGAGFGPCAKLPNG
jgi:hypothetical protein